MDLLTINNRILEPTATRSQLDPQVLAERLPRRQLMYKDNKPPEAAQNRRNSTASTASFEGGSSTSVSTINKDKTETSQLRRTSTASTASFIGASGGAVTTNIQSPPPFVYEEELDIEEYRTKNARLKEYLTFEPGFALQFENTLASSGHKEYVTVIHNGVPATTNETAKRVEPTVYPTLPLIRKPKLYTAY